MIACAHYLSRSDHIGFAGTQVATTKYGVDLTAGIITMANPWTCRPISTAHTHSLREMARVVDD